MEILKVNTNSLSVHSMQPEPHSLPRYYFQVSVMMEQLTLNLLFKSLFWTK